MYRSPLGEEEEQACMQEIKEYLQSYDNSTVEPGLLGMLKQGLSDILKKHYSDEAKKFVVDVIQTGETQVSVTISPREKRACPKCMGHVLSRYSLETQPITWVYFCPCGWEGSLD